MTKNTNSETENNAKAKSTDRHPHGGHRQGSGDGRGPNDPSGAKKLNTVAVVEESLKRIWQQKTLWFFGFFAAALTGGGGGGGGNGAAPGGAGGGGVLAGAPAWLIALIGVGIVAGLLFLVLHLISEGALIESIGHDRRSLSIREGLSRGRLHMFRILGVKLLMLLGLGLVSGLVAVPVLLGQFGVLETWATLVLVIPLAIVALPLLLSFYFIYEYAMRFVVLDGRGVWESLSYGRRFLHRRLGVSLRLGAWTLIGQAGAGMVAVLALLPAGGVFGLVYWLVGLTPAAVAAGILAAPVVIAVTGAFGAFRSAIWTEGFYRTWKPAGRPTAFPNGAATVND
jgi:hypothetical protein